MSPSVVIFYILSAGILLAAVLSVTTRKIFRAAIWLLLSLIGISGLYFWLEVEFIAAIQIIVYVGGIVVLIIFSIFLTQQSGKQMSLPRQTRTIASVFAALCGFALTFLLIAQYGFHAVSDKAFSMDMDKVGSQMMGRGESGFVLPLEVVSILLLAAMVGCIVIAMKTKQED